MPTITRLTLNAVDPAALRRFYTGALGFTAVAGGVSLSGFPVAIVQGAGRYPHPAHANDPWFQHFAIASGDASAAWTGLIDTGFSPISAGGPVQLPPSSGSVIAGKFRDPDGHALEFSQFASGPWHGRQGAILGIDHTALAVADVARSVAFYKGLGCRVGFTGVNTGPTQDALDGMTGVTVDIVVLETDAGPHLELLGYRAPLPAPARAKRPDDIASLVMTVSGTRPEGLVQDPDGHWLDLVG